MNSNRNPEESQAKSGHDVLAFSTWLPSRYAEQLVPMNDIVEPIEGMTPPGEEHVRTLLDWVGDWDRAAPMVVHCFAGISRSTAAAYSIVAALNPGRNEMELARTLRARSPSATPNRRIIAIADRLLGRDGRMLAAIDAIGRGADAFEGTPFFLEIDR